MSSYCKSRIKSIETEIEIVKSLYPQTYFKLRAYIDLLETKTRLQQIGFISES